MQKVYVTAPEGRYVPGLGTRAQGEFFEVDEAQAEGLLALDGFGAQPLSVNGLQIDGEPAPRKSRKAAEEVTDDAR